MADLDDGDVWTPTGPAGRVLRLSDVILYRHTAEIVDLDGGLMRRVYDSTGTMTAVSHFGDSDNANARPASARAASFREQEDELDRRIKRAGKRAMAAVESSR